jgi:hypothetical protein
MNCEVNFLSVSLIFQLIFTIVLMFLFKPLSPCDSRRGSVSSVLSVSSQDSETINDSTYDVIPRRNRKPSGFVSNLNNSEDDSDSRTETGSNSLSWGSVISPIILAVHKLNDSIKNKVKSDYMYHAKAIVDYTKELFEAAGILENDSNIVESHPILKVHYLHLMETLGDLIVNARTAAGVWPPPDALVSLKKCAGEILLNVRQFASAAQESGLKAQGSSRRDQSPIREESDDQDLDVSSQLNELILLISTDVLKLNRSIQNPDCEIDSIVRNVRKLTLHVGEFLIVLGGIPIQSARDQLSKQFANCKQYLFQDVGNLVIFVQNMTGTHSFATQYCDLLKKASELEALTYKTLLVSKLIINDKDDGEIFSLLREVQRLKGIVNSSSPSKDLMSLLDFKPRRALSVNLSNSKLFDIAPFLEGEMDDDALSEITDSMGEMKMSNGSRPGLLGEKTSRSMSSPGTSGSLMNSVSIDNFPKLMHSLSKASSSEEINSGVITRPFTLLPSVSKASRATRSQSLSSNGSNDQSEEAAIYTGEPVFVRNPVENDVPWYLEYEHTNDTIALSNEGFVRGGTLGALLERLTSHHLPDANFTTTFLMTYRSFTTTMEFFDLLFQRFNLQIPPGLQPDERAIWMEKKQKPVRLRVLNVLKTWLDSFYYEDEPEALEYLRQFALTSMNDAMPGPSQALVKLIAKRKETTEGGFRKLVKNINQVPQPLLPKSFKNLTMTDIDPLELARQLTIVDSQIYNTLKPHEFLNKAWSNKDSDFAPNVKAMIEWSNQVTHWFAQAIIIRKDVKKRLNFIKFLIVLAEKLFQMNNFNCLMSLLAAFSVAPVYRLRRTWDLLNGKTLERYEYYKKVMDSTKNFSAYREILHSVNPPCVPFLGVYLTDLTFNEDGNNDYMVKNPNFINYSKQAKTAEIINEIQQYQNSPYCLSAVAELQNFLKSEIMEAPNLTQLYELSLMVEPKEREDQKICRLLTESGFL